MKKRIILFLAFCMMIPAVSGMAATNNSFAIVNTNQVNLREKPGGDRIVYLDAGENVLVLETKEQGGRTWHRVMVAYDQGRRYRQGWMDASFLTDVRDQYTGVVQAAVGDRHVLLRFEDGRVDTFGFDFRGNKDTKGFGKVDDIAAARFNCFGLSDGTLMYTDTVYVMPMERTDQLEKLISNTYGGDSIMAIDREGQLVFSLSMLENEWEQNLKEILPQGKRAKDAVFGEYYMAALTEEGEVYVQVRYPEMEEQAAFMQAEGLTGVKKLSGGNFMLCALMTDGTIKVFGGKMDEGERQEIASWRDVRDMTVVDGFVAAAMADGSVRVAGKMISVDKNVDHFSQDQFMNPQKEGLMDHWENIVALVGNSHILVGIRADGGIEAVSLFRYE